MKAGGLAGAFAAVLVGAVAVLQQAAPPRGVVRAGQYDASPPAAPVPAVAGAVYDVGPFPLATPDLAPGEGRDPTMAVCSGCHSVRYITMQPRLPPETWAATVRKMMDVHGAAIPDDVAGRITGYLQAHYASGPR